MFTNNYISYRAMMLVGDYSYNSKYPSVLTFYDTSGTEQGTYSSNSMAAQYSHYGDVGYWLPIGKCTTFPTGEKTVGYAAGGVFFGSGSTPATKDDYTLEAPITSGLSITNQSKLWVTNDGNGKYEIFTDYIVRNTTDAEINIYEIGVVTMCGKSSEKFYPFLMERTVLSEPITIPAGEVKLVTYKVTFNQTLNVE